MRELTINELALVSGGGDNTLQTGAQTIAATGTAGYYIGAAVRGAAVGARAGIGGALIGAGAGLLAAVLDNHFDGSDYVKNKAGTNY